MAIEGRPTLYLSPISDPAGASLRLEGSDPHHVGRDVDNELRLSAKLVSRRHAVLSRRQSRWYVTDVGSKHGTFVNSRRLPPEEPTPVDAGDMIRFGPCTYRLVLELERPRTFTRKDALLTPTTEVRELPDDDIGGLAYQRLALLMDGAAEIDRAGSEAEIASSAVRLAREGSGYGRATMLRAHGDGARFEVLAAVDGQRPDAKSFRVSHTLLRAAEEGKVVHLATAGVTTDSVETLAIQSALCVPVLLDGAPIAQLYLDSRAGEDPPRKDAAGFCAAIARLCSHRFGDLRRKHLEELEKDLRVARTVQKSLSPSGERTVGPLRCACRIEPGRYVAGDWFDVFEIGEGRVAICFGDVCGHELGSAIVMASVRAYLRAVIPAHSDPAAAARQVNRYVGALSDSFRFVTLFVGIFDPADGVLEYVDAGHGYWMIKRKGQAPTPPRRDPALVIGVQRSKAYAVRREELSEGDRLILYSDGLVEPRDPDGEMFGDERLAAALADSASPPEDVERAFAALGEFARGRPLADDTSVASIEVTTAR